MGTTLLAKTPFIKSFDVNRARGQLTGTFNVTFEMIAGTPFPLGQQLKIKAGIKGNLKTVFTGFIESTKASPAFGKPSYFSILLSGRGVLSQLENKKFSRRLKSDGQGMFCLITGGSANRPNSYNTLAGQKNSGNQTAIAPGPSPASTGEHSQYTVYNSGATNQAAGGIAGRVAGRPQGSGSEDGGTGGGLTTHTHESIEQGGPSFGVYSSD